MYNLPRIKGSRWLLQEFSVNADASRLGRSSRQGSPKAASRHGSPARSSCSTPATRSRPPWRAGAPRPAQKHTSQLQVQKYHKSRKIRMNSTTASEASFSSYNDENSPGDANMTQTQASKISSLGFAVVSKLVNKVPDNDTEPATQQAVRHPYSPQGRPSSIPLPSSSAFVLPKPPPQPRWRTLLCRLARGAATLLTAVAFHQVHASCSEKRRLLQDNKSPSNGLPGKESLQEDDDLLAAEDGIDDGTLHSGYEVEQGDQKPMMPRKVGLVDALSANLDQIFLATGFTICVAV